MTRWKPDPAVPAPLQKTPGHSGESVARGRGYHTVRTLDDEAKKQGWVIIRIRNDWKKIFAFEQRQPDN